MAPKVAHKKSRKHRNVQVPIHPPKKDDRGIDCSQAVVFSDKAPLSHDHAAGSDDYRAVWTYVPEERDAAKPTLLVYFHGHYTHVLVDSGGKPQRPHWWKEDEWHPGAKPSDGGGDDAGNYFQLGKTADSARQKPIVLCPEVGQGVQNVKPGSLESRGALAECITDALEHLNGPGKNGLTKPSGCPSGARYLDPVPSLDAVNRLYLAGHSAGGAPLAKAAVSDLVLSASTPADLWLLDCTYHWGMDEYVEFCTKLDKQGKLGYGPDKSRLVAIAYRDTGTDFHTPKKGDPKKLDRLTDLIKKINKQGLGAGKVKELSYGRPDDPDISVIKSDLQNGLVAIRVKDSPSHAKSPPLHFRIPIEFIPILLETAA